MTGDTQNPLSLALTLWLMTPVFWIVIAILFLGLELINRRLVLFLPVTISSLIIAVMVQSDIQWLDALPLHDTRPGIDHGDMGRCWHYWHRASA
jgi:hypothetical protein